MRKNLKFTMLLIIAVSMTSCYRLTYSVGEGAKTGYTVKMKNHYLLDGLIKIHTSDPQKMAGGAKNYDVSIKHSFLDELLAFLTSGIYTPTTTTVRIMNDYQQQPRRQQYRQPQRPRQQIDTDDYDEQVPTQMSDLKSPSNIQVSGWYYKRSSNGSVAKIPVSLTVQERETGDDYPQYLILSINGKDQNQTIVASRNKDTGMYIFNWGNTLIRFYME